MSPSHAIKAFLRHFSVLKSDEKSTFTSIYCCSFINIIIRRSAIPSFINISTIEEISTEIRSRKTHGSNTLQLYLLSSKAISYVLKSILASRVVYVSPYEGIPLAGQYYPLLDKLLTVKSSLSLQQYRKFHVSHSHLCQQESL